MEIHIAVRCPYVTRVIYAKLCALSRFSGQPMQDLASFLLENGIHDAWEGYRENPKHRHEIEAWEKERISDEK